MLKSHSTYTQLCVALTNMRYVLNFFILTGAVLAVYIGWQIKSELEDTEVPVLRRDVWWGRGECLPVDPTVNNFTIDASEEVIKDLNERLDLYLKKPVTPPLENTQFQYGFNTDHLRKVIQYWKDIYLPAWKQRQNYLNSYPQFVTTVNGLKLHYIRVSPPAPEGKRVLPLLLLHGWPGSVREFYEIIPLLTRPNDKTDFIFEVIAPSLPGYGFSEGAAKPGMGPAEMAVVLNNLMEKLGFTKYYVQGGDWGGIISKHLGQFYPNTILGVHSNLCIVSSLRALMMSLIGELIPALIVERHHAHKMYPLWEYYESQVVESGYLHIQATKSDTVGAALSDTPAGLAAYLLEKVSTGLHVKNINLPDGGLSALSTDAVLDDVMLYWLPDTAISSSRLYAFGFRYENVQLARAPINVPTACARFPKEFIWQSTTILKLQYRNLIHVSDFNEGGHFPALEHPTILAQDIFTAISKMENLH